MKSLFFKLYVKLICAISIFFAVTWVGYTELTKHRELNYWQQQMSGFIYLIEQGAQRHQGEARKKWLNIAFQLVDLSFNIIDIDTTDRSASSIKRLAAAGQFSAQVKVDDQVIEFYFSNISKSFMEGVNKLILNELGIIEPENRESMLGSMSSAFNYPVQFIEAQSVNLSAFEKQQLATGLVLFRFDNGISALSHIGQQNRLLKIGSVQPFNPYPTPYLFGTSLLLFLITLFFSLAIIRPVDRRFSLFSRQVDVIKLDQQQNLVTVAVRQQGNDQLSELSSKVEDMANRIIQFAQNQQQMTRAVSHEIRTPLVKMNYRIASLESTDLSPQQNKMVTGLKSNITELDDLVNELLLYSSLDRLPKPELKPIDIEQLVKQHIKPLQQISKITLRVVCSGEQVEQATSESYLNRILQNLLTNAQRYARSQVIIRCSFAADSFSIQVEDDGQGVSKSMSVRIFEPFVVDDDSRNIALNGHGLGLSIVKKMTELLNGDVRVKRSEFLGGANFVLTFNTASF